MYLGVRAGGERGGGGRKIYGGSLTWPERSGRVNIKVGTVFGGPRSTRVRTASVLSWSSCLLVSLSFFLFLSLSTNGKV